MSTTVNVEALLTQLALSFAEDILRAAQNHTFDELFADVANGSRSGPRSRPAASPPARGRAEGAGVPDRLQGRIVAKLRATPAGLRAEQLRAALGVDKPAITSAIRNLLESGGLRKTGQKRSTTYFAT